MSAESSSLIKNSAYNIVGQFIPIAVGFITIPSLIKTLGMDRFGLLSLLWVFLGYLTFFDLGLSRAIIKLGADLLAGRREEEVPQTVWTTLWITSVLSLIGTLILTNLSPYLISHYFKIPTELETEGMRALNVIALSLPVVTLTSVFRGVLESQSKFFVVNILQAINGTMTYLSPLLITVFTSRIDYIIIAISLVRLALAVAHWVTCTRHLPALSRWRLPTLGSSKELVYFGSWLTISNVISPIMVYFDRFFLGSLIPVGELAYYTTPYEIITRVLILPAAVSRTLFPAFSASLSRSPNEAQELLPKVTRLVGFLMAIIASGLIAFASLGLELWLGSEFAAKSTALLQIFAFGIFFNAMANIPYTFLQSAGRPDLTAKLHLIELPLYLLCLWYAAAKFGSLGAAWAWSLRLILDCFILLLLSARLTKKKLFAELDLLRLTIPLIIVWIGSSSGFLTKLLAPSTLALIPREGGFMLSALLTFGVVIYYWGYYLRFDERVRVLGHKKPAIDAKITNDRFGAVIVTYNPNAEFKDNLAAISAQFDSVCIVDNGSTNASWIKNVASVFSNAQWVPNSTNLGLGAALNQGMKELASQGFSWVATFDQDSLPSPSYLNDLKAIIAKAEKPEQIGILAPSILEKNLGQDLQDQHLGLVGYVVPVSTVITSGSLTNINAYESVGRFEESFFIDYIDHNFAFRLRKAGFLVAECPRVHLLHRLGETKAHQFLFKKFYSTHHNPVRRYYITRNRVQFYKEFFLIDPAWVINDMSMLLKEVLKIFLAEKQKWTKLQSILLGFFDGIIGKSGPYRPKKS